MHRADNRLRTLRYPRYASATVDTVFVSVQFIVRVSSPIFLPIRERSLCLTRVSELVHNKSIYLKKLTAVVNRGLEL